MKLLRTAGMWLGWLLVIAQIGTSSLAAAGGPEDAKSAERAPLFRVFLNDGQTLVSYGEFARVDDRVVFSMPTSDSAVNPQLQLVNIPSERVDWDKTAQYADAVRAERYLATRAESDYAILTTQVTSALNEVSVTSAAPDRLLLVEQARRMLAEWPASHFNYKSDEIQQMLGVLDEAIADLRAVSGASSFDLSLVAAGGPPPPVRATLLPSPGPREMIEGTLAAATATTTPAERESLLTVALNALDSGRAMLPPDWVEATRTETLARLDGELELDRKYQSLSERLLRLASTRAALADVRGVQRVLDQIPAADARLGTARPDVVASMVAAVGGQLDAARRLRLERDRWALRAPAFREYRASMATSIARLRRLTPLLEDIKSLAGSGPNALGSILRSTTRIRRVLATVEPPSELRDAHNLFVSAVQLADSAAAIRREAAVSGSMPRAWDASSAAAGALMLAERAQIDMNEAMRSPQLHR